MQFKPECLYIFDTRNVVNEFTGHKQVLYSLRRDDFDMITLHLNCVSGLVSLCKQFYQEVPQELQLENASVLIHESREKGVIYACVTSQLSAGKYLALIDSILLSQLGSYSETMGRCGLRYLRDLIESLMGVILECLGEVHPGFLPLQCVVPQPQFQTLQLTTQVREQLLYSQTFFEVHAVQAFSPQGEYVSGTGIDFSLRALIQSLSYLQQQNKTPRTVRVGHEATEYLEYKTTDEYAARKGRIEDPDSFTDQNTELRCGRTRILRHAFSSVFAGELDNPVVQIVKIPEGQQAEPEYIVWAPHVHHDGQNYIQFTASYMDLIWVVLVIPNNREINRIYVQQTVAFSQLVDKTIHEVVQFAGQQVEDEAPDLPEPFYIDTLTYTAGLRLKNEPDKNAEESSSSDHPAPANDLQKIAKYLKYYGLEKVEEDGMAFENDLGRFSLAQI